MPTDQLHRFMGDKCHKCGGEAPNWKCPKCGKSATAFDPSHWQKCSLGGKMQAECDKCHQAEDNCTCAPIS